MQGFTVDNIILMLWLIFFICICDISIYCNLIHSVINIFKCRSLKKKIYTGHLKKYFILSIINCAIGLCFGIAFLYCFLASQSIIPGVDSDNKAAIGILMCVCGVLNLPAEIINIVCSIKINKIKYSLNTKELVRED